MFGLSFPPQGPFDWALLALGGWLFYLATCRVVDIVKRVQQIRKARQVASRPVRLITQERVDALMREARLDERERHIKEKELELEEEEDYLDECERELAVRVAQLPDSAVLPQLATPAAQVGTEAQPGEKSPETPTVALPVQEKPQPKQDERILAELAVLEAEGKHIIAEFIAVKVGCSPRQAAFFLKKQGYVKASRVYLPDGRRQTWQRKPQGGAQDGGQEVYQGEQAAQPGEAATTEQAASGETEPKP
jgi:hypothetical protein